MILDNYRKIYDLYINETKCKNINEINYYFLNLKFLNIQQKYKNNTNIILFLENNIKYVGIEIILKNYLKIIIKVDDKIIIEIIKLEYDYLDFKDENKLELLNYSNRIKKHICSKNFIIDSKNKQQILEKLNNIIFNLKNLNIQKTIELTCILKKKFIL